MAISTEQKFDIVTETAKAAPPVVITAASTVLGFTLNELVAIATLIYIGVQVGWLIWKWYRAAKNKDWTPK